MEIIESKARSNQLLLTTPQFLGTPWVPSELKTVDLMGPDPAGFLLFFRGGSRKTDGISNIWARSQRITSTLLAWNLRGITYPLFVSSFFFAPTFPPNAGARGSAGAAYPNYWGGAAAIDRIYRAINNSPRGVRPAVGSPRLHVYGQSANQESAK